MTLASRLRKLEATTGSGSLDDVRLTPEQRGRVKDAIEDETREALGQIANKPSSALLGFIRDVWSQGLGDPPDKWPPELLADLDVTPADSRETIGSAFERRIEDYRQAEQAEREQVPGDD